jgi:hypothetical protein
MLADKAGFVVDRVIYDSASFQFWGSELYKRDIPLKGTNVQDHFTAEQLSAFAEKAVQLNLLEQGDQAAFFLRKK